MSDTKENDTMELYAAVQKYIENRGGKVLIIGGVSIIQFPDDPQMNYSIAIKITGRKPSATLDKENGK